MPFTDLISADYLGVAWEESALAKEAYLGETLFSPKKQTSLDLKWIKGAGNLPVTLAPAAYDAEVALRSRMDVAKVETEMPLFREGIQLTEKDRRGLMDAEKLGDSRVREVLSKVYDDSNNLIRGAKVVSERMVMQLLAPADGKPKISISGTDVTYAYDYDPAGKWYASNFTDASSSPWSTPSSSTPIDDTNTVVQKAAIEGKKLRYGLMSQKTFNELMSSAQIKNVALSRNEFVYMTPELAKSIYETLTGIRPIVYNAIYAATEKGKAKNFFPDKVVTFIPEGTLGNMVYAATPEEFDSISGATPNKVRIVENGIAITSSVTSVLPLRTTISVSEVVLPSFERMDEVYELKVDADE